MTNPNRQKQNFLNLKTKKVPVTVYENHTDKWIVFSEIFEGINLELNFNTLQGEFTRRIDDEKIITFIFKYHKQLFKITKEETKIIKEFFE